MDAYRPLTAHASSNFAAALIYSCLVFTSICPITIANTQPDMAFATGSSSGDLAQGFTALGGAVDGNLGRVEDDGKWLTIWKGTSFTIC
jgi:hypothetical protein